MRIAAIVYVLSAFGLLAVGVTQAFTRGIDTGILLTLVVVAALMFQAINLFRRKPKARWPAFFSSIVLTLSFGALIVIILSYSLPLRLSDPASRGILLLVLAIGSASIGHFVAAVFLARRPNLSLNADVPHAGLRPGSGPPVS